MNRRLRTILQYTFFLGLGIFLVWWSVRSLTTEERGQISASFKDLRYFLIIPVVSILFFSHYIRALRWRLLMTPLGYAPSTTNTFLAVMIGYLANQAVPRLGEVLRCTVLARYEKVPADKLVGTIILERLIDVLSLLLVFVITFAIQPGLYDELISEIFSVSGTEEKKVSGKIALIIMVGIFAAVVIAWMIIKKKSVADVFALAKKIIGRIWEGVSAVQHLRQRKLFLFYTVLIWTCYLFAGYLGFHALQETEIYGIKEAFTVLSAGSVGMVITPGGIGGYAFLVERCMVVYGLQPGVAFAFGLILWVVNTGVVLIGGLASFVVLPWYNKKKLQQSAL